MTSRIARVKSKLRKLQRDPHAFLYDALRARLPVRGPRVAGRSQRPATSPPPTSEAILAYLAASTPVLFSAHESRFELGILEAHLELVVQVLLWLAEDHGMTLSLARDGGRTEPIHSVSRRLMSRLAAARSFNLQLERNGVPIIPLSLCIYRWRGDTYVTREGALMEVLPRAASVALSDPTARGVWYPEQILEVGRTPAPEESEAIDVVYTWVNADDPEWRALYATNLGAEQAIDRDRFVPRDELRYSLRSIYQNADWVRRIHIVSNCAPPPWLDVAHPRIRWVDHSTIIAQQYLPTFNSHAIEAAIHLVPGVSKKFVYLNDDFFIMCPVRRRMFFDSFGRSSVFLEAGGKIADASRPSRNEDWYASRVYAQRLLLQRCGIVATRLLQHAPYVVDVDVCNEIWREFEDGLLRTYANRLRAPDDVALMPLVYGYRAMALGKAVSTQASCQTLNVLNYRHFRLSRGTDFLCVNDGGDSSVDEGFGAFVSKFMNDRFPIAAPWEIFADGRNRGTSQT